MNKVMLMVALLNVSVWAAWAAEETTVEGKLGCGHCNYEVGKGCSAAIKSADGKVYLIDKPSKEMMKARMKTPEAKVTGKVENKDGQLLITDAKVEIK